jgi:hypothetical protein
VTDARRTRESRNVCTNQRAGKDGTSMPPFSDQRMRAGPVSHRNKGGQHGID